MRVFRSIPEISALDGLLAVTVGFFDGVHLGHQSLLAELGQFAAVLGAAPLVITFANSPKAFHTGGEWQFLTLPGEKLHLLGRCGVESVLMLDYDESIARMSAAGFFREIGSHCPLGGLLAGYDSAIGCDMISGEAGYRALAAELSIELQLASPVSVGGAHVKSSLIRECIAGHELVRATELLGRPYLICGVVEHGKGKGSKELNIPTANIYLLDAKLAPPTGIYAARAEIGGETHPAPICIMEWERSQQTALETDGAGRSPSVEARGRVVEAYLIGYDGNLYGREVALWVEQHIRDWIDFESAEQLARQIRRDIEVTREICGE